MLYVLFYTLDESRIAILKRVMYLRPFRSKYTVGLENPMQRISLKSKEKYATSACVTKKSGREDDSTFSELPFKITNLPSVYQVIPI